MDATLSPLALYVLVNALRDAAHLTALAASNGDAPEHVRVFASDCNREAARLLLILSEAMPIREAFAEVIAAYDRPTSPGPFTEYDPLN